MVTRPRFKPVDPRRYLRQGPYIFNRHSVRSLREKCGLFVLYSEDRCLLVARTKNLLLTLMKLFEEPDECLKEDSPIYLEVEYCSSFAIEERWAVLVQSLESSGIQPLRTSES